MARAVGIDLGTTNSVVSVLEGGYGETNIGACVIQHLLGIRDGVQCASE